MIQKPCWEKDQVTRVVKPDAEEIDDHIFRAIHSSVVLKLASTVGSPTVEANAEELLARFLEPERDYVQAVVLGESGSGKSHLIQWLRLHIPDNDDVVKLTIPKTGTSLRGIVERLINELPLAEQEKFSTQLRNTGTQSTSQNAKIDLFLSSLAWSIEHGGKVTDEVDDGLRELLPAVFLDPNLRADFFRRNGGTVDQMVKHIFDPPDERGPESIRQFSDRDLPLDGRLYQRVAAKTKDAIDFINADAGILPRAIVMMNACLEGAIAQAINFSADNLIDLMNALRRHLEKQGKKLILLIEDFARLQGIDTALLQALITPPGQGRDRLCELRWAMAVTTGYFRRLDDTVRTRANIVVDMDESVPTSVEAMTSTYLNAVRVGERRLLEERSLKKIPNVCTKCNVRESCFSAFGDVDGIGLFPFTRKAISIFADRTGASTDSKFNPRRYLRAVIEPVMFTHYSEIERGEFPSTNLLNSLGGARVLSPATRAVITSKDGDELGERRIALLELWNGSGKLLNLGKELQAAFGIPKLRDANSETENVKPLNVGEKVKETRRPEPTVPHINDLQAWESGNQVLPQTAINELRIIVFSALESYIDWDELGFKKSEIASAGGGGGVAFRKVSINFHDQQVQRGSALAMLTVPLDPESTKDRRDTALALQALVFFKRYGNWDFKEAHIFLPILLNMLERWADHVKAQINELYSPTKTWNPAIATAELMTLCVYQSGRNVIDAKIDSLILKVWELKEPSAMACLTPQFGQANKKIIQHWPILQKLIRLLCSGTKGGQAGNFVNPLAVTSAVCDLRKRSLKLTQDPPADLKTADLRALAGLYSDIKSRYQTELEVERKAWLKWGGQIDDAVGINITVPQFLKSLAAVIVEFEGEGLSGGLALSQLKSSTEVIKAMRAERARDALRRIDEVSNAESLLRIASASRSREEVDDLISKASSFLGNAESVVKNRVVEETQKAGPGLQQSREAISSALGDLIEASERFMPNAARKS